MADHLLFSRSLYAVGAVEAAAQAFGHLAKLEIRRHENETELVVSEPDPEVAEVLLDEIANHVLFATITRHRGS